MGVMVCLGKAEGGLATMTVGSGSMSHGGGELKATRLDLVWRDGFGGFG